MIWFKDYTLEHLTKFRTSNMGTHIGLELVEVGDDFLKGRMPVDERTTQPFGILHGGANCVLSETLGSIAAWMTMQNIKNHAPELFPFPIAEEAAQIVYEDLYDEALKKTKPIALAVQMAEEVGYTFDETAINQWRNFANRAQEMAWMGFDKNKILSTAIYTSEDPYVRSMAYLVSETLNLHPAPLGELQSHNPFTDQEVNERGHAKKRQQTFENIITGKTPQERLMEIALHQNQKLLQGHVMGWCAHALLEALMAYQDIHEAGTNLETIATKRFNRASASLEWKTLLRLNRIILRKKRAGIETTPEVIKEICAENEGMETIASAMDSARPTPLPPEPRPEPEKAKAADDNAPAAPEIQIDERFN